MKLHLAFALVATFLAGWAMSPLPAAESPANGASPDGTLKWHVKPLKDGAGEILLALKEGGPGVKLCDAMNVFNAKVFISPDDKWLIVEDGGSSVGVHLSLYKKASGAHYTQEKLDFDDLVAKATAGTADGKKIEIMDHTYLTCKGWSPNSKFAKLVFGGHGASKGQRIEVSDLKLTFSVEKMKVSLAK